MAERDENGRLKKGHGGLKPKGATSEKTRQWESLAESIVGIHADHFNDIMKADYVDAMEHEDDEVRANARTRYTTNYVKIMEYFKPKQSRTVMTGEENAPPVQIIVKSNL